MRILVCGKRPAAAALAALLAAGGEDAVLLDLDTDFMAELERSLWLHRDGKEREYAVPTALTGGLEGVYDGIWLAVSSSDLDGLLRTLSPHVHRSTFYLDLSGNLGYQHIGEMVGSERVLLGVPGWAGEWVEEGRRARLVGHGLCIGEVQGTDSDRARESAQAIARTDLGPVHLSDSCGEELWAALCYTLPLGSLEAILGQGFGELVELPGLPNIVLKAAGEVREVARSLGFKLDAPLDWSALKESENGGRQEAAVKDFFKHARGLPASQVKSPLLADLESRRPTDNRFLAGYVAEKARGLAITTPVSNTLFTVIREMERGERKPSPDNLRELVRRIGEDDRMFLT